jgi:glyoxylase-like metal-dependent hydrolase (beta-lactamase superfamily II)
MVQTPVSRAIDVRHLGRDRVICAHEVDGLIIDPGPSTGLEALLEALGEPPRGLLLTHIHLDHAGASGTLAARFPGLPVYVHEVGAPHLADPSKLLRSAERLYGDRMGELWGEVAPVPEESIRVLRGGETVEGFRVAYTPGHASHHVCYLHEATGEAFVGDVAGVRIPPAEHAFAPTPPPDIDIEQWLRSIDVVRGWQPTALGLTHFGRVEGDVGAHLARVESELLRASDAARGATEAEFVAAHRERLAAAVDEVTADRFHQAAPPEQLYAGLTRYWRKREEGSAAA